MKPFPAKRRGMRLGADAYRRLHQEILKRCQACGSLSGLDVHHNQRRSQLGDDSDGNLITLCSECPRAIHTYRERRTLRGRTSG